jgi:hypothetical protein
MPNLTYNDEKRHSWKICTSRRNFQKKVSYVDYSDSKNEDNMVGLAKSVKGMKVVSCLFGEKEPEKFCSNITKTCKNVQSVVTTKIDEALAIPYHTICRRA